MRVIMFKDRFAEAVREGLKRQTVRRRANCVPGDFLSLRQWTGKPRRSKQQILRGGLCKSVQPCVIEDGCISVDGIALSAAEAEKFARADGFKDAADMFAWFRETYKGKPLAGELIKWV